jgi:hypothetical protein
VVVCIVFVSHILVGAPDTSSASENGLAAECYWCEQYVHGADHLREYADWRAPLLSQRGRPTNRAAEASTLICKSFLRVDQACCHCNSLMQHLLLLQQRFESAYSVLPQLNVYPQLIHRSYSVFLQTALTKQI